MAKVGVIGSGSWGTALAWLLCNNGHHVTLWSFRQEECDMFREHHENKDKLHELANFLYEKETITGEEFMQILES